MNYSFKGILIECEVNLKIVSFSTSTILVPSCSTLPYPTIPTFIFSRFFTRVITPEIKVPTKQETKKDNKYFTEIKQMKGANMPKWLEFNSEKLTGKINALPQRDDIDLNIREHLIVELYSK